MNQEDRGAAEVPDLRQALPRIVAEFQRARRYERALTVAVFTVETERGPHRPGAARGNGHGGRPVPAALASALRQAMRETDLVAWQPSTRRSIVVMPEIGGEEGKRAVERVRALCATRLDCATRAGIAEFPSDGWTFEDLVAVALKGEGRKARRESAPLVAHRPAPVEPLAAARE